MSPFLDYLWPSAVAGAVIGMVAMTVYHRREMSRLKRWILVDFALLAAIGASLLWSGPLGGGRQFINRVEGEVNETLAYYEMTQVHARLGRAPLNRQVLLEGPADDFQKSELARIIGDLPGVSIATWNYQGALPIIVEGAIASWVGFLIGWLLAYLVEWRRRENAQWSW